MIKGFFIAAALILGLAYDTETRADTGHTDLIGGFELKATQLPQMQMIWYRPSDCTATLIGPQVILTAAHCIVDEAGYFVSEGRKTVVTSYSAVHPNYKKALNLPHDFASIHDIGLVLLKEAITDIVPLSISKSEPKIGDKLIIAGKGRPMGLRKYGWNTLERKSPIGISMRGLDEKVAGDSGDSGGPVLIRDENGSLSITAVLSTSTRTRDWPDQGYLAYTAGASLTNDPSTLAFMLNFALDKKVQICGINIECEKVKLD